MKKYAILLKQHEGSGCDSELVYLPKNIKNMKQAEDYISYISCIEDEDSGLMKIDWEADEDCLQYYRDEFALEECTILEISKEKEVDLNEFYENLEEMEAEIEEKEEEEEAKQKYEELRKRFKK